MSQKDKRTEEEKDIIEDMQEEIAELENDETNNEEAIVNTNEEKNDTLAKVMADFENYKKRVERDKEDMIHFLKADILKIVLPRIDDIERILKNTPSELQDNALFEGLTGTLQKLLQDLKKLGVEPFDSIGEAVDPNKHDVMTVLPGKPENIIVDEFEKGYTLNKKILRHAKVVAGAGE